MSIEKLTSNADRVPDNCPRVKKLVLAYRENDFITKILRKNLPELGHVGKISELSENQFYELENKLNLSAIKAE